MRDSARPPRSSDHFDGRRYFNPDAPGDPSPADLLRFFRMPRAKWPREVEVSPARPSPVLNGDLRLTCVGHATFLIQTSVGTILTDPVFGDFASPLPLVGPRRVRRPGVALEHLPPIDLVLLSHNHYDHCDADAIRTLIRRFSPRFATPVGNGRLLRSLGALNVTELDWWERAEIAGMDVAMIPARHFSARTPFDRNRALWGGFVVQAGSHRVLFAGDSGYGPHFREIGDRHGPFDLALLPIGAYEPRWFMRPIHMNPEEAVQAHVDVRSARSVAMHHGVFQLTLEPIDEPVERLAAALEDGGIPPESFRVLEPGATLTLPA